MTEIAQHLETLRDSARAAGVFGSVEIRDDVLVCTAADAGAAAEYRLWLKDDGVIISLVTGDRWLSESIEAELMHTGDSMEELLEDELVEVDYVGETPKIRHFRSDELMYTFESRIQFGGDRSADGLSLASKLLSAYEAMFRELGDMDTSDELE